MIEILAARLLCHFSALLPSGVFLWVMMQVVARRYADPRLVRALTVAALIYLSSETLIRRGGLVSTCWEGEKRWWRLMGVTNDRPVGVRLP